MTLLAWLPAVTAPPAEKVTPGLLGFFVIVALAVVTFLLWRSMNRQLRKVDFEEQPPGESDAAERPQPPPPAQPPPT